MTRILATPFIKIEKLKLRIILSHLMNHACSITLQFLILISLTLLIRILSSSLKQSNNYLSLDFIIFITHLIYYRYF
jgi:hypothetical protein